MAAESQPAAQGAGRSGPSHGIRIFTLWIVVSVVADLLIGFVLAPHLPPGTMSSAAHDEQDALIEFLKSLQVLPPGTKDLVVDERFQPKVWAGRPQGRPLR